VAARERYVEADARAGEKKKTKAKATRKTRAAGTRKRL
jgi:hypothetical protein